MGPALWSDLTSIWTACRTTTNVALQHCRAIPGLAFKTSQGTLSPRTLSECRTLLCVKYGLRHLPGSSFLTLKLLSIRGRATITTKTLQVFKVNTSRWLEPREMNTAPRLETAYMSGTSLVLHTVGGLSPHPVPLSHSTWLCTLFPVSLTVFWDTQGKAAVLVWFVVLAGLPLSPPQLSHSTPLLLSSSPHSHGLKSSFLAALQLETKAFWLKYFHISSLFEFYATQLKPQSPFLHSPLKGNVHILTGDLLQGKTTS